MKISKNEKLYTISELSPQDLTTMMYLLGKIRENTCYLHLTKNETALFCPGDGYLAVLKDEQLESFHTIMDDWEKATSLMIISKKHAI
jgi:hypothetical protein